MIIKFDSEKHTYTLNDKIVNISFTQLLRKHNLAPNYSGVSADYLSERASIGEYVHKDLENLFAVENYEVETAQAMQFKEWANEHIEKAYPEQRLAYDFGNLVIAGTSDLIAIGKDGSNIILDYKNTSAFHREYVTWQVNLGDYIARKIGAEEINGVALNWKGADKFYCVHFNSKTFEMNIYELEKIPDEEIERLIRCEQNGVIYQKEMSTDLLAQMEKAEIVYAEYEKQTKAMKAQLEELREKIYNTFEEQGLISFETDNLKITRVLPTETQTVDSAKLKKEYKEVYDNCLKTSKRKGYLKVTIK